MMDASCNQVAWPPPSAERDERPDRLGELLECLADLRVETARQREQVEAAHDRADPRAREAVRRLVEAERLLGQLSAQAAIAHQSLRHARLI